MKKKLIVDIGNSIISYGVFIGDELKARYDMSSDETHVAKAAVLFSEFVKKEKLNGNDFDGGLISSVVPMFTVSIKKVIKKVLGLDVQILDESFYKNIEMIVDNRAEVGGDIVADVVAAKTIFGGPALVIDLGTITKNIIIDDKNVFIGVSFFPGVKACISAMRDKTALLPGFELNEKPEKLIGTNTIDAMRSGVFYATLNGIKSLAKQIEEEYKLPFKKILTGGNASIFKDYLPNFYYDEDFVLKGINYLLENRG